MRRLSPVRSMRRRPCFEPMEGRFLLSGTASFTNAFAVQDNDGAQQTIAVDAAGDTYVTGYFDGYSDFDPGPGTKMLTNSGTYTAFLAKYSSSGSLLWADPIGGANALAQGTGVAIDGQGNAYVTGGFSGTVNFNPAGTYDLTFAQAGNRAGFVAEYNSAGNFVWADAITPTGSSSALGGAIAADSSGNVFVTGDLGGPASFGPGGPTVSAGSAFVARYTSAGVPVWAEGYAANANATLTGIALDGSDNVYSTGFFNFSGNFSPGPGVATLTNGGGSDIFVTKLNSSGGFDWAGRIGGPGTDTPGGIAADSSGNVFVTGTFSGTANLDPGSGTYHLTATAGHYDAFVERINTSGNLVWADAVGGTGDVYGGTQYQSGDAVAIDSSDNVYFAGSFSGTADFDPGASTYNLTAGSQGSMYVERINAAGTFGWATATTGGGASADGVGVDSSRGVYVSGQFGVVPPTFGTITPVNYGNGSFYVTRLSQSQPYTPSVVVGASTPIPAVLIPLVPGDGVIGGSSMVAPGSKKTLTRTELLVRRA